MCLFIFNPNCHSTYNWNKTSSFAEEQQAWLPQEFTAESTGDHLLKTASKVPVTKSPGALFCLPTTKYFQPQILILTLLRTVMSKT